MTEALLCIQNQTFTFFLANSPHRKFVTVVVVAPFK